MAEILFRTSGPANEGSAHVLELRPRLPASLARAVCQVAVNPYVERVTAITGADAVRILVESEQPYDIAAIAAGLGQEAYPGEKVQIEGA